MNSIASHGDGKKQFAQRLKQNMYAAHSSQIGIRIRFGVVAPGKPEMFYDRAQDDDIESLIAGEVVAGEIVEIAMHKAEAVNQRSRIVGRIDRSHFVAHREHGWNDRRLAGADLKRAHCARREIGANPTPVDELLPLEIKSSARRARLAI